MLTPEEIAAIKSNWVDDLDDSREMRELCDLALRGLNAGDQWQPMESAPEDATSILLWAPEWDEPISGYWHREHKCWRQGDRSWGEKIHSPTHWQPLPTPPAMKETL